MKKIIANNGTEQKLYNFDELCKAFNFEPQTTKDLKRVQIAYNNYVHNVTQGNCGAFGIVAESFKRRPNSLKATMSRGIQQGAPQAYAYPLIDGKRTKAESKVNGGRLDDIKDKYIIYTLKINNSTGCKEIAPRLIKTETFLRVLTELKAIKTINKKGVLSGFGIQCSNRKLWKWLESIPPYDHSKAYRSDEII